MNRPTASITAIVCLALMGCEPLTGAGSATGALGPFNVVNARPDGAAEGTCWGNRVTPAIIETVEREVLVQPAQVSSDGRIQQPAIYRKDKRQEIVQERTEVWTQIVCPIQLNADLVSSLQRALAARGAYAGPISGTMDARTEQAVRRFQMQQGSDVPVLTVATARQLGLIAVDLQN